MASRRVGNGLIVRLRRDVWHTGVVKRVELDEPPVRVLGSILRGSYGNLRQEAMSKFIETDRQPNV